MMEIFSPPRVTPHSPAAGVEDAGAWGFTSGWAATDPMEVRELWSHLAMTKPTWVVMSPPCGKLSKLQTRTPPNSRRDVDKFDSEVKLEVAAFQLSLIHI